MATIRALQEGDVPSIIPILGKSLEALASRLPKHFAVPRDSQTDQRYLLSVVGAKDSICLVAEVDEEVIGYVIAYARKPPSGADFVKDRRVLWVDDIAVEASHQRKGIGGALLQACEEHARSSGYEEVQLDLFDFNADGAAFYGSQGYRYLKHTLRKELERRLRG